MWAISINDVTTYRRLFPTVLTEPREAWVETSQSIREKWIIRFCLVIFENTAQIKNITVSVGHFVCMYVCVCVCVCVCVRACVHACMHACIYIYQRYKVIMKIMIYG